MAAPAYGGRMPTDEPWSYLDTRIDEPVPSKPDGDRADDMERTDDEEAHPRAHHDKSRLARVLAPAVSKP